MFISINTTSGFNSFFKASNHQMPLLQQLYCLPFQVSSLDLVSLRHVINYKNLYLIHIRTSLSHIGIFTKICSVTGSRFNCSFPSTSLFFFMPIRPRPLISSSLVIVLLTLKPVPSSSMERLM